VAYDPPGGSASPPEIPPPMREGGEPTRPVGSIGAPSTEKNLVESYRRTVLSPSVENFEEEIPRASWAKVFIGIGLVMAATLVAALTVRYLFAALLPDLYDPLRQVRETEARLREANLYEQFRWLPEAILAATSGGSIVVAVLSTPIFFFLGAGATYLAARIFGGRGGSFLTHSYLLSLSYAPLRVVSNLVGLVPVVSGIASLALFAYQLYLAGQSMQASQRMEPGKAMMAAFVPLILTLVLLCVGLGVGLALIASSIRR
jgi:hypothetical protein